MTSEQSKRELRRRRREQLDLADAAIRQLESWLAAGDYQHLLHSREVSPKRWVPLTAEEQRAHLEERLAAMKEHRARWEQPFAFEIADAAKRASIPKTVTRAIRKLRKRTRRALKKEC